MSTSTLHSPREHPTNPTRGALEGKQTVRLGTYADGQRAADVKATYSPRIGSFGHVERK